MALIDRLLSLNHAVAKAAVSGCPLPSQTFFFGIDGVVCFPRDDGDSRYPYSHDGLTLWAYASGYLSVSESFLFPFSPRFGRQGTPHCLLWRGGKRFLLPSDFAHRGSEKGPPGRRESLLRVFVPLPSFTTWRITTLISIFGLSSIRRNKSASRSWPIMLRLARKRSIFLPS